METYSLIILGNGFDVALGIPTRYSQFYERSRELREIAAHGNRLCQHILNHIKSELWSDLENDLGSPVNSCVYPYIIDSL